MNITSINTPAVQASSTEVKKPVEATTNETKSPVTSPAVRADISQEGMIGSYLANLDPQQQAEVEGFLSQVHQQKANGTFDVKAMTKQAPNTINELSSLLDVSTEGLLSHIPIEAEPDIQAEQAAQLNSPAINAYMSVSQQSQRVTLA